MNVSGDAIRYEVTLGFLGFAILFFVSSVVAVLCGRRSRHKNEKNARVADADFSVVRVDDENKRPDEDEGDDERVVGLS